MSWQRTYRIIKPDKWYIVDTYRIDPSGKPMMLKKEYDNSKQAKNMINYIIENLKANKYRFDIIQGSEAIFHKITIRNGYPSLRLYLRKYNYSDHQISEQQRKSYRTKFRRQNRTKQKNGEFYKKWG